MQAAVPQGGQCCEADDEAHRHIRARQNLVPKARTKKELAERKADEEQLAAIRKDYHDYGAEWRVQDIYRNDTTVRFAFAKVARLESDCCVTLVVSSESECVCGTHISGSLFFLKETLSVVSPVEVQN